MLLRPSRSRWVLVVAVGAAVVLIGCVGQPDPDEEPTSTVGLAVQPGVEDPYEFVVEVRNQTEDGPPMAGATVVFFMKLPDPEGDVWSTAYLDESDWPQDGPLDPAAADGWKVLAVGTTDAEGQLVGRLDPAIRDHVSVAVGGVPGYTTEAFLSSFTTPAGPVATLMGHAEAFRASHVVLPLYRTERPIALDSTLGSMANGSALPVGNGPAWAPVDVEFDPATRGYLRRLVRLDLELRWNNTPTAHGDLYLLAGPDHRPSVKGSDRPQTPLDADNVETLDWTPGRAFPLRVGPATDTAVVAPDGLPYTIRGTAYFDGAPIVLPTSAG